MKTIQFLLLCLTCYNTSATAQPTFSISPNPVVGEFLFDADCRIATATFQNLSASTDTFVWVRTNVQIEPDSVTCFTPVADPFLSYLPSVVSRKFWLGPMETSSLQVSMCGDSTLCCGIIFLTVNKTSDPSNPITAVYLFGTCTTGISEPGLPKMTIAPNPADNFIRISETGTAVAIRFYSVDGRYLKRLPLAGDQLYSIAELEPGTFIVVPEDRDGRYLQAATMIKR